LKRVRQRKALTGKPLRKSTEKKEPAEKKKNDVISYTSGNETIIMPAGYKESNGMNVVFNIIIGLVLGFALMWWLVIPAKIRSVRNETNEQVREYSDQISAKEAELNKLQKELGQLVQAEGEAPSEEPQQEEADYEKLIEAYVSFQAGEMETAATALEAVERDLLSGASLDIYNEIYKTVRAVELQELFAAGSAAYEAGNYEEAVERLKPIVEVDEIYENGYALYYLARSYEKLQKNEEAVAMFERFVEHLPQTERGAYAAQAITRLQQ